MKVSAAIVVAMSMDLGLSSDEIEKSALDFGLVVTADYAPVNKESVNAAAAQLLCGYLLINSRSEGGFSISINANGVKGQIAYLANNSGGKFIVPDEFRLLDRRVRARHIW